jgi:hypothetical protein
MCNHFNGFRWYMLLIEVYRYINCILGSMVCSIGNGRMAVMARLLVTGSLSQNIAGNH